MNTEFFKDQNFMYTEIVTVLEKFHYTSKGKFFINTITPLLSSGAPITEKQSKGSTKNILNYKATLNINNCTTSNFIELSVPRYIGEYLRDYANNISKGQQFIVTFVGGDLNKPRITGVY